MRRRCSPEQRFIDEYQYVQRRETVALVAVVRRARKRGVSAEAIAQYAADAETNEGLPRVELVRSLAFAGSDDRLGRTERIARMMVDDGLGVCSEREIITYAH